MPSCAPTRKARTIITTPSPTADGKRKDGPTAPAILAIMAKHLNQSAEQLDQAISYDDPDAKLDVKDVMHQIAWFKEQGMLPRRCRRRKMIDAATSCR